MEAGAAGQFEMRIPWRSDSDGGGGGGERGVRNRGGGKLCAVRCSADGGVGASLGNLCKILMVDGVFSCRMTIDNDNEDRKGS